MNFVSICNPDGQILSISDNVEELLGYSSTDLIGFSLFDKLINRNEARSTTDVLRKAMRDGLAVEHLVSHKTGMHKRFKTYFQPVALGQLFPERAIIAVSESLEEAQQLDQLLDVVATSVNSHSNEDFFRRFIMHITAALRVDYAFITVTDEARTNVTMLAFWKGNQFVEGKSYDLRDTPCDAVINEGKCCYFPIAVQGMFPKDRDLVDLSAQGYLGVPILDVSGRSIGHLAILHKQPLKVPDRYMSVLRIFAFRASPIVEGMRRQVHGATAD